MGNSEILDGRNTLKPRHKAVAALLANGMSVETVARTIGCSERTVYNLKARPDFAEFLAELSTHRAVHGVETHVETEMRIRQSMSKALDTVEDLLEHAKSEQVRHNAAVSLLHMGGMKPKDKIEHKVELPHLFIADAGFQGRPDGATEADVDLLDGTGGPDDFDDDDDMLPDDAR